jgi:hypothetical protein
MSASPAIPASASIGAPPTPAAPAAPPGISLGVRSSMIVNLPLQPAAIRTQELHLRKFMTAFPLHAATN